MDVPIERDKYDHARSLDIPERPTSKSGWTDQLFGKLLTRKDYSRQNLSLK